MLESTDIWQEHVETDIKPQHEALVEILCRHLDLAAPNDRVHLLAFVIESLGTLLVWKEVTEAIAPGVLSGPENAAKWLEQVVDIATAIVEREFLNEASPVF